MKDYLAHLDDEHDEDAYWRRIEMRRSEYERLLAEAHKLRTEAETLRRKRMEEWER